MADSAETRARLPPLSSAAAPASAVEGAQPQPHAQHASASAAAASDSGGGGGSGGITGGAQVASSSSSTSSAVKIEQLNAPLANNGSPSSADAGPSSSPRPRSPSLLPTRHNPYAKSLAKLEHQEHAQEPPPLAVDPQAAQREHAVQALQPAAIHKRIRAALENDQRAALSPNYWAPFTSTRDIIDRLLPYHVFDVPDEDLRWALAPPKGEARLRQTVKAKRVAALSSALLKGKGKAKAEDTDIELSLAEGISAAAEIGIGKPDVPSKPTRESSPRKRRRSTQSSSSSKPAIAQPTEPPDPHDSPEADLDSLLVGDSYAFPSLPLAMSYYWSGLSLQQRLRDAFIRSDGGEPPGYIPPPLTADPSAAGEEHLSDTLVAPAHGFNTSLEHLERLAFEEEKNEQARLMMEFRGVRAQLEHLHRTLVAAQAPPPARPAQQQAYRSPAPLPRSHSASGTNTPSASGVHRGQQTASQQQQQQQQAAVNQSQVPSGTINPTIPTTPIPLLIPLDKLTALIGMDINPTPALHLNAVFRKAIIEKPDLQQNPHSLLLAAERIARNARTRRMQLSEGLQNNNASSATPALLEEIQALDALSVSPKPAAPNQEEAALLMGISLSVTAATPYPGPDEFAQPPAVMLHISVVLAKLSATQLSNLATLMQGLQQAATQQAQASQAAQRGAAAVPGAGSGTGAGVAPPAAPRGPAPPAGSAPQTPRASAPASHPPPPQ